MADVKRVEVKAPNVAYCDDYITSDYTYAHAKVSSLESGYVVKPKKTKFTFRTRRKVPKTGMMLVGWGGNNGTTVTGGILANRHKMSWRSKTNKNHTADYVGSITQSATMKLGFDEKGEEVYAPLSSVLPMVHPNNLAVGGWDISKMNLGDAMQRACVFPISLQDRLYPMMREMRPLPSIYYPEFIAANQKDRANNVIPGKDKQKHLEKLQADIRNFKRKNKLDKVIVLWTANTERFCKVIKGVNDTAKNLLKAIKESHPEVSPSTLFGVASVLEGCSYINGSPQNTFVPGLIELAGKHKVFIGGDDFKSGQTKMKSVLVDFLVSAGMKPMCITSYNHLGNNDGKNLSSEAQFRSKEISKSNVVDDMVKSNQILYRKNEKPDHLVVIKYVPFVRDSKRALDEYTNEIFMGGLNTIVLHNTCEDSLLAAPLIIDLVILTELAERIEILCPGETEYTTMDPVLSFLSFLLKAPLVPGNTPVVNSLFRQLMCIKNIMRACIGMGPESAMLLHQKLPMSIRSKL
mmetsp:Transcript_17940/g.26870  ORF Transcript_17940/g.26870 Transcript_17940/m.26870 type:complete len:520 (-) Transcript_17940:159-1718(-)